MQLTQIAPQLLRDHIYCVDLPFVNNWQIKAICLLLHRSALINLQQVAA